MTVTRQNIYRHIYPHRALWLPLALIFAVAACSSDDLSKMEEEYPQLSDIPPAPEKIEGMAGHEGVIEALLQEAEARRAEGYQGPIDDSPFPAEANVETSEAAEPPVEATPVQDGNDEGRADEEPAVQPNNAD